MAYDQGLETRIDEIMEGRYGIMKTMANLVAMEA
jgi:hypothetical protein